MAPRSLLFVLTAVGAGCAVILSVLLVGLNHRDQQKPISVPQVKLRDGLCPFGKVPSSILLFQ